MDVRERWTPAIDLGVRIGLYSAEVGASAMRRLEEAGAEETTASLVASWLACTPEVVEDLLRVASCADAPSVEVRSMALAGLATALLGGRSSPPTVPLPDGELPTAKFGTPEAETPTAKPSSATPRPNVPHRLGPYVLGEELGHGGMGIVFRARHEKLGSGCAVKVMIAGEHASQEAIARFQREAATVARMGKHPNIVTVHDLGQEGALAYYAMELVEGKSLRVRMKEGEYASDDAATLLQKVTRAVHFSHQHGVIHRDLKPENIVVRDDGEPQVMDFGLARDVSSEERLSVTGQVMGTLAYMAPEQARGDLEGIDARTDVYALGGVLYELLTGIPPHRGNNHVAVIVRILRGEILPPRKVRPDLPRDLETVSRL